MLRIRNDISTTICFLLQVTRVQKNPPWKLPEEINSPLPTTYTILEAKSSNSPSYWVGFCSLSYKVDGHTPDLWEINVK